MKATLHTSLGDIRIQVFNSAPAQCEYFLRFTRPPLSDRLTVTRVVRDLMVQITPAMSADSVLLPSAGDDASPVFRGAVALSHKRGGGFFLIPGHRLTDADLDRIERNFSLKLSPQERAVYRQKGGAPELQGQCTVIGEVITGLDVLDKIAALPRDAREQPLVAIPISIEVEK